MNQEKLLNDLIRENPDATVGDFVECLNEIEGIEQATEKDKLIIAYDPELRKKLTA